MALRRRGGSVAGPDIWPGFVDALASLLIVIIFLIFGFVISQVFLSNALTGRDEALGRLGLQIKDLSDMLALERQTNAELRINLTQLSSTLQGATRERDDLVLKLGQASDLTQSLTASVNSLLTRAEEAEGKLVLRDREVDVEKEIVRTTLLQMESLRRDLAALQAAREALEKDATTLRDRSKELEARVAGEEERTRLAQKEVEAREIRLTELQGLYAARSQALDAEKAISAQATSQVAVLNQQLEAIRRQLQALQGALNSAENKDSEQQVMITELGRRLNQALAQRVEELSRYRSEFFGRLREVLANRRDIQIVGDRFVFQSDVLFPSGSADLNEQGKQSLQQLAKTLLEIMPRIPPELPWVLRVDGHTDRVPIRTAQFPSNWELSSVRAINVVRHLVDAGVPPNRVAAAGFGEFQPLDAGNDEAALRRNRRIEIKLTER